ncbi:hypothetical protein BVRB_4g083640 [Beta vulgaris subsp. vulgaris]|uniref:uncharacterized protein LOC104891121 n=1 Tax=Beta vulgaris subsp. vulgaris TaxID=3555 RepID=UPI00053FAA3B|nr:uncharacterized protein LOC104891121 [Beta vulgaris subsp. vulgaris]XP_048499163.1 uncharacterized protein LOC104891121 [Beta vulgaris subsp. vulgaris]XP_048499164.1 uncharacterized protein LOC104891121 [Beta vulgaris subsp. vulgaris]KMT13408.1 hypothetical protein BVRB_4g083640 [Beta vulgaris subsp. vulgaris]
MANYSLVASAALLLVLLPITAFGNSENCSQVTCGKGTCKSNPDNMPHGFVCECDSGWRRTRLSDSEEQHLQFLPCIIPNCSINYSCMPAAPPLPPIPTNPHDNSIFNPCNWVYCGEGTCRNSSDYMHMCQCQPGAYNLFNASHFPCYSDCAFGSDCSKLGINVSKGSVTLGPGSSPSPSSSQTSRGENHGMRSWKLTWIFITMMSLAATLW